MPTLNSFESIRASSRNLDPSSLLEKDTSDQYPTERVQYEVLLFDELVGGSGRILPTKLAGKQSAFASNLVTKNGVLPFPRLLRVDDPLDVAQLLSNNADYKRPPIGGALVLTQSWYTKGAPSKMSPRLAPSNSTSKPPTQRAIARRATRREITLGKSFPSGCPPRP